MVSKNTTWSLKVLHTPRLIAYVYGTVMVYHLSIDLLALKLRDGGSIFPTGWLYFSVRVALKLRDGGFFRPIFVIHAFFKTYVCF